MKEIQIRRKENPNPEEGKSKPDGREIQIGGRKSKLRFPNFISQNQSLTSIAKAFPASNAMGGVGPTGWPWFFVPPLVVISVPPVLKASEGLAPFSRSWTFGRKFPSDLAAA
jgi:hypothetical protein